MMDATKLDCPAQTILNVHVRVTVLAQKVQCVLEAAVGCFLQQVMSILVSPKLSMLQHGACKGT